MNKIKKEEDLLGKTIAQIYQFSSELWIKFSDGDYCLYQSYHDYDCASRLELDSGEEQYCSQMVTLGLITETERIIDCDKRAKKWRDEQSSARRELFEKLKKEFGE